MGTIKLNYRDVSAVGKDKKKYGYNALSQAEFSQFNASILELGAVKRDATTTNALAAVFDLENFTGLCNQIDQHLVVPEFLAYFLDWLFVTVSRRFKAAEEGDTVRLWGSLPFFGKFTGDGVLFLWNTDLIKGVTGIGNVAISLLEICQDYSKVFYPSISKEIARVPKKLRVGIARGLVLSIGDERDFVGPCINMAARLQKLGSLSFAMSRRGCDPKECFSSDWQADLIIKRIAIRGIGEEEPVLVLKDEYSKLNPAEKRAFVD